MRGLYPLGGPAVADRQYRQMPPATAPARTEGPQASPTPLSAASLTLLSTYFVVIWGAGFVASRVALQYAAPFSYIGIRYGIAALVSLVAALLARAVWPSSPRQLAHIAVAGLLTHAGYLGGSHYAQFLGMSAGVTALILALQPIVTALIAARWMSERLSQRQQAGVVVGFAGVALVVAQKFDTSAVTPLALACTMWSLLCVTAGTLYQRHFCSETDLRTTVCLHFTATSVVMLPAGLVFEGFRVAWVWPIAATLVYHVLLASIGAYTVFHFLMRRGQATGVTSLLYLTPPVAVICEWLIFGTLPGWLSVLGMAVACAGVAMVSRRQGP